MKKKTAFIFALLLPLEIILVNILANFPLWVENYYSKGLYPIISKFERYIFGWLPFSLGDFLYAVTVILILRWLYVTIRRRFFQPKIWIVQALAFCSVFYGLFHLLWGINYYRLPLHQSLEIKNEYTEVQLESFASKLVENANRLHSQLAESDSTKIEFPFKNNELRNIAVEGYLNVEANYPELTYRGHSVKPSLFSIPLTYMGFNGYLNPFTNEAQVNNQIPKFKLPSTISHEIGHQVGFAKENEANFMACITLINHPNNYFRYSGYTFALKYCLNDLYATQPCKTENLIAQLHPGILKNYREVELFWQSHENPLEPFFKLFYGGFLKVNNQPQGIKSYNYVVALLVNYDEKIKL